MPPVDTRLRTLELQLGVLEKRVDRHDRILCRLCMCLKVVWPVIVSLMGLALKNLFGL